MQLQLEVLAVDICQAALGCDGCMAERNGASRDLQVGPILIMDVRDKLAALQGQDARERVGMVAIGV